MITPPVKTIASAANSRLKHLAKLLSQAKARREHGQTVLEGVHLLQMYLQAGYRPQQVYVPETKASLPEIRALLAQLPENAVTLAGAGLLSKASGLAEADDVMALVNIPEPCALPSGGDCVVLERVQDPGNVGTIMRSAAAAGVRHIVLDEGCADVWSPKVLRAGMGAHFMLAISPRADLAQWAAGYGGRIWATALSAQNPVSLYGTDLRGPAAWVFGNEGSGIGAGLLAAADGCVHIPMAGQTESLNVAMAATVCLFEQMRQRQTATV